MRVTIIDGAGVLPLCVLADGESTSPANLSVTENRESQQATGLRWRRAKQFPRGNKSTTVTFDIERISDTLGAGEKLLMEHATLVPENGLVEFKFFDGSSMFLEATEIKSVTSSNIGKTTKHSYSMIGGEMITRRP